ncbi:peptidylprolyl isomerase [Polaribacter reichenbachii]|uniref:Peptidyl-prolyl cis-trans isomerase n=1 Tax=Polaribacter reichenbachii TaxID=996801 RepID=A0A1B8TPG2_9FLAO|nr:FKBP-type peptidyl-prolyl cis-trans isomerase [Polaribacter reichenbachii]APZ46980.1 peptidylprolyl isomerase [Polaribacter reichenbachii]AUC17623.1 peptidylprolyl isomerase [Polaribacter reichenbachii]OBY61505.1 peptidylprolyl isomerase [Polaribacter reichenbachii]
MRVLKNLAIITVLGTMVSCGNQVKNASSLETEIDSASYALGMDMALKVKANFDKADTDLFLQGYRNGIDSTNLLIEEKDLNNFLRVFFQKQQAEKMKEQQAKAEKDALIKFADNKKAGEEFLALNKVKDGIETTESGLQYIVLKEGKGENIKPTDKVKIHYHGTTIDGEVFDSTVDRKSPYTSNANVFVPGFNEALSLMKVGSKYKVFIPQELAYGAQQRGQLIKPFSTLVFEIEMLEIIK